MLKLRRFLGFSFLLFLLVACTGGLASSGDPEPKVSQDRNLLVATDTRPSATPFQPATATPVPTHTPLPTATPSWEYHPPGQVVVPILLYHHIVGDVSDSRYFVSVPDFRNQMRALHDWGYTAIPISLLVDALTQGAELPSKPIVITFDDGSLCVYENAFPIMQEYKFPGVVYIIARNLEVGSNVVHTPELKEMIDAGWEVGSHGFTHADLSVNHGIASYEITQSKQALEQALGVDVQTFAYPYGLMAAYLVQLLKGAGFRAGMGLGTAWTHTGDSQFYLNRIEIHGDFTLEDLAARLPWTDE